MVSHTNAQSNIVRIRGSGEIWGQCTAAEGKPEDRVYLVGYVMIDNLLYQVVRMAREAGDIGYASGESGETGEGKGSGIVGWQGGRADLGGVGGRIG